MQPISNRAGGSLAVLAAGSSRSAGRWRARRGPSPGSAARRCAAAAGCAERARPRRAGRSARGGARRSISRTGSPDSRRRCAAAQGSSSPTASSICSSRLARRAFVPFAVAADDFEQLVGGGVAVARGHQRAGKLVARLDDRRDRRATRASSSACLAGRRDLGQRQRRAGAGDRRVLVDLLGQIVERGARLVDLGRRRSARGRGRKSPRDARAPSR